MVAHGCTAIAAPRTEGRPQAAREHGPHDPRAPRPAPVALPLPRRVREGRRRAGTRRTARPVEPEAIIDEIEASGLRGRGGAGFPTGAQVAHVARTFDSDVPPRRSWSTPPRASPARSRTATILRHDPYRGARGRARSPRSAVGADHVIVATKASFAPEVAPAARRHRRDRRAAGWTDGVDLDVFEGPDEYLYGEETALLEVIDGRYPFPRIAPPYRRGVDEVVEHRRRRHGRSRPGRARRDGRTTSPTHRRRWSTTSRRSPTSPRIVRRGRRLVPRRTAPTSRRAPSSAR